MSLLGWADEDVDAQTRVDAEPFAGRVGAEPIAGCVGAGPLYGLPGCVGVAGMVGLQSKMRGC